MVLASSNKEDLVLDPFCGVGTGPLVCLKHNRKFIGFEKNKQFVRIIQKKLNTLNKIQSNFIF